LRHLNMPRGPCRFRQKDVTRAVRAAQAAGINIGRVEIDPATGRIAIETNSPSKEEVSDLDKWISTRAHSS
jgi:hypothetical protein